MDYLTEFLLETWNMTQQMAPYLLFGFLMSGLLSVTVSPETVERHLGKKGIRQIIKAALLGVPLPLCSCSIVPLSATLYRHGAGKGATISFLASTPQTGVDSISVTWALLGPVFVLFRVAAAFFSGILAGIGVELIPDNEKTNTEQKPQCGCHRSEKKGHRLLQMFHYGFITLPRDIGRAMLFGLLLSGLISTVLPPNFFADKLGSGFISMLVMVIVGIPIYTCSSGSVPIAFGLIRAGLSPGAALVFLVTGPATNAATITTIADFLGKRAVAIYLVCISATAIGAGMLLNVAISGKIIENFETACKHPESYSILSYIMSILLIAILMPSLRITRKKKRD